MCAKIRAIGEIAVVDMFEHALERGLTDISADAGFVQYDTAKGICNALSPFACPFLIRCDKSLGKAGNRQTSSLTEDLRPTPRKTGKGTGEAGRENGNHLATTQGRPLRRVLEFGWAIAQSAT